MAPRPAACSMVIHERCHLVNQVLTVYDCELTHICYGGLGEKWETESCVEFEIFPNIK